MSLLFMDGFDDGLSLLGKWSFTNNVSITTGGRQGNRALMQDNSDSVMRRTVNTPDEHATFIVGFAFMLGSSYAASSICNFYSDALATSHISMGVDNNNAIVIRRGDGTVLGTSSNNTLTPGVFQYVEIKVTLGDAGAGGVEVRVNGATVLNLVAIDTKNGGTKTVLETVSFNASSGPTGTVYYLDDIYICNGASTINNDFLGDCTVYTLLPVANGTYSNWGGSDGNTIDNYLLVDDNPVSTADYVASDTPEAADSYEFTPIPMTGNIKGVVHRSYASKSDAGDRSFRQIMLDAGDTIYGGPDIPLGTAWAIYSRMMEESPESGAAWMPGALNSDEFGVQVR